MIILCENLLSTRVQLAWVTVENYHLVYVLIFVHSKAGFCGSIDTISFQFLIIVLRFWMSKSLPNKIKYQFHIMLEFHKWKDKNHILNNFKFSQNAEFIIDICEQKTLGRIKLQQTKLL